MTEVLFQNSMDDLRAAFVLGRLKEGARLGFSADGIDAWLMAQRSANDPDDERWRFYMDRCLWDGRRSGASEWEAAEKLVIAGRKLPQVFGAYAAYLPSSPQRLNCKLYDDCDPCVNALVTLIINSNECPVYLACNGYCVVSENGVIGISNEGAIASVTEGGALAVAYASWAGHSDPDGIPQNRHAARGFLCDWLGHAVRLMRENAEIDFNGAVAVNEGGTKILSADFVFVYSETDFAGTLYTASSFFEEKILLPRDLYSNHALYREVPLSDFLSLCAHVVEKRPNAKLMTDLMKRRHPFYASLQDGRFLFISSANCPPMPDGGEMRCASLD